MQEGLPQLIASLFTILFAVLVMIKLNLLLFGVVLVSLAVSMAATGYVSKLAQRAYGENRRHGRFDGETGRAVRRQPRRQIFNLQESWLRKQKFKSNVSSGLSATRSSLISSFIRRFGRWVSWALSRLRSSAGVWR